MAELANTGDVPVSFGKYRLHRLLASGGMGRVYLADLVGELGFEKRLVVKTILPELGEDPLFVELFAAEAKTAVALSHGNIVPIYELGRCEGVYYIAMGYVDGPSLAQLFEMHRCTGRPIPLPTALFITREVLTGMAYAHLAEPGRAPVVHRDLSPRNVMLDRSGQVRIVDFGIAMPSRMRGRGGMGSMGYVSPEQARAAPADPRADVFSVACLLYELLTSHQAYPKPDVWAPADLSAVPSDLRAVLGSALSVDPCDRPADAAEFLDALAPALARHAVTYGDKELAAHLQALFPSGWQPVATDESLQTPKRGPTDAHQTFATRFTVVTSPKPASRFEQGLRWLAIAGAVAGLVLTVVKVTPLDAAGDTPTDRTAPGVERLTFAPVKSTPKAAPPLASKSPERTVEIRVQPADSTLEFENRNWQGSPFLLQIGRHPKSPAVVRRAGYESRSIDLTEAGPLVELALSPARLREGRLSVLTPALSWAEVQVDGKPQRNTPLTDLLLPVGRHRVVVRCVPDVCENPRTLYDRHIRIESDRTTEIKIEAEP